MLQLSACNANSCQQYAIDVNYSSFQLTAELVTTVSYIAYSCQQYLNKMSAKCMQLSAVSLKLSTKELQLSVFKHFTTQEYTFAWFASFGYLW